MNRFDNFGNLHLHKIGPQFRQLAFMGLLTGLAIACQSESLKNGSQEEATTEHSTSSQVATSTPADPANLTEPLSRTEADLADEAPSPIAANTASEFYTSESLEIHFAYPKGYVIDRTFEEAEMDGALWIRSLEIWTLADYEIVQMPDNLTELPPNLSVRLYRKSAGKTFEEWMNSNDEFILPSKLESIEMGGRKGFRFQSQGLYGYENVALIHPTNTSILLISLATSVAETEYKAAFESILATLEFTKIQ